MRECLVVYTCAITRTSKCNLLHVSAVQYFKWKYMIYKNIHEFEMYIPNKLSEKPEYLSRMFPVYQGYQTQGHVFIEP